MKAGRYFIAVVGPLSEESTARQSDMRRAIGAIVPDVESIYTGSGADEKVANRVMNAWNTDKNKSIPDIDAPCGV